MPQLENKSYQKIDDGNFYEVETTNTQIIVSDVLNQIAEYQTAIDELVDKLQKASASGVGDAATAVTTLTGLPLSSILAQQPSMATILATPVQVATPPVQVIQ